jgi:hypothetical protein
MIAGYARDTLRDFEPDTFKRNWLTRAYSYLCEVSVHRFPFAVGPWSLITTLRAPDQPPEHKEHAKQVVRSPISFEAGQENSGKPATGSAPSICTR